MSTPTTIYHVCHRAEWQYAQTTGVYGGSSQDQADGFIHFSGPAEVKASVAKHRTGQDGLVIIAVAPQSLGESLRWEVSRGGRLFPHLYAPLPLSAVKWVADLPLGPDGAHVFPAIED
jgi:uncharacterized protein (DUF952 family)